MKSFFKNIDINIINEKGELTSQNFPKSMLIGIIKPRVEEIFDDSVDDDDIPF